MKNYIHLCRVQCDSRVNERWLSFACALRCVQQVISPPRVTEHAKDLGGSLTQRLTENSDKFSLTVVCESTLHEAFIFDYSFIFSSVFFLQVVVMEGMNTTGRKLVASKLYEVSYELTSAAT